MGLRAGLCNFLRPGMLILGDQIEGVIVDWDDMFGLDQLNRSQGIRWPHGEIVTNGQNGQVDPFFADQAHITEKTGILG